MIVGLAGLFSGRLLSIITDSYQPAHSTKKWLTTMGVTATQCYRCRKKVPERNAGLPTGTDRYTTNCDCSGYRKFFYITPSEWITALLFMSLVFAGLPLATLPWYCGFIFALLALTIIDYQHGMLPDAITQPLLWAGFLFSLIMPDWSHPIQAISGAITGYLSLYGLYGFFLILHQQEGMGLGDIKLFAALGAWCGWQPLPFIALIASSGGLLYWLWQYFNGSKRKMLQPFGPFLSLGGYWTIITQQTNLMPLPSF